MSRLFVTDSSDYAVKELSIDGAVKAGAAIASLYKRAEAYRPKILVGRDTRASSDIISAALETGIMSAGCDVVRLGVIPSPAAAFLAASIDADGAVMVTAPKNSAEYSGLKLYTSKGTRASAEDEDKVESAIRRTDVIYDNILLGGRRLGRYISYKDAKSDYIHHIQRTCEKSLSGLKIAVDCVNGAAYSVAEELFKGLKGKIYLLNCEPDGNNLMSMSECIEPLAQFVKSKKCDAGILFDEDGDRCIALDEKGNIVDGDKLTAIFASDLHNSGGLPGGGVVITTQTNLGFVRYAEEMHIKTAATKNGERHIFDRMESGGYYLGGEPSGYIIFRKYASVGDGILSAIQLLSIMKRTGKKLSELASVMERYPQVMINVKIDEKWKENWKNIDEIENAVSENQAKLGSGGRVIVRENSSESVIKIITEGKKFDEINDAAIAIAKVIENCCTSE